MASSSKRKRKPYQKRFHKPLIPIVGKTTSKPVKTQYMRDYMRMMRDLNRKRRYSPRRRKRS